jgi:hypothetical protein
MGRCQCVLTLLGGDEITIHCEITLGLKDRLDR